jgi:hypothetical protein
MFAHRAWVVADSRRSAPVSERPAGTRDTGTRRQQMELTTSTRRARNEIRRVRSATEKAGATARGRVVEPVRSKVEATGSWLASRTGKVPPLAVIAAGGAGIAGAYVLVKRSLRGRARELNDPTLENKVQSEIFRDADAPKGKVSVNVEHGVVFLRGELDSAKQIEELVDAAALVEGVKGVENLLHEPARKPASKRNGRRKRSESEATKATAK